MLHHDLNPTLQVYAAGVYAARIVIGLAAFMRGQELSTLVVILSVIMGSHFQVIKLENRVFYSH